MAVVSSHLEFFLLGSLRALDPGPVSEPCRTVSSLFLPLVVRSFEILTSFLKESRQLLSKINITRLSLIRALSALQTA